MSAQPAPRLAPATEPQPSSLPVPVELLDALASRVSARLAEHVAALKPPEPYLSAQEAAAYIAAPVSRVHDLAAANRLRHYRDGRRLLFRREDLDALLTVVEALP